MMENAAFHKTSARFWAWMVALLGGALVLTSLAVSYNALFRPGLGWWLSAILAAAILGGLIVLWAPVILLIASLFVWLFAPPGSMPARVWRYLHRCETRQRVLETDRSSVRPAFPSAPTTRAIVPSSRRRWAAPCR
jgi:hypothetical protein